MGGEMPLSFQGGGFYGFRSAAPTPTRLCCSPQRAQAPRPPLQGTSITSHSRRCQAADYMDG